MWEVVASVLVAMFSSYWGAAVLFCPMIFAAHEFGKQWTDYLFVAVLYSYPAALFGILYALDMEFFGANPLAWAKWVLIVGAIMLGFAVIAGVQTYRCRR